MLVKKYKRTGEHLRVLDHDDSFHILSKYSDEIVFIRLKPLRDNWIEWHILTYIEKTTKNIC